MKLTPLNKALIASNILLVFIALAAARYETPRHKREDALNALMSFQRTENLQESHVAFQCIESTLRSELGRDIEIEWAGIEWVKTNAMLRTHATTTEGKRYVVQVLLEPNENQQVQVIKSEVIDVTDTRSGSGL